MVLLGRSAAISYPAAALPKCRVDGIATAVLVRFFLTAIFALAMALGPLAMPGEVAMAAAPASHHGMTGGGMVVAEHCPDQPQRDRQDREGQADKGCCIAGCMAVAAFPTPAFEPARLPASRERPAPDRFRLGYLGEIATPPPRSA
jgi:hypothetical protein